MPSNLNKVQSQLKKKNKIDRVINPITRLDIINNDIILDVKGRKTMSNRDENKNYNLVSNNKGSRKNFKEMTTERIDDKQRYKKIINTTNKNTKIIVNNLLVNNSVVKNNTKDTSKLSKELENLKYLGTAEKINSNNTQNNSNNNNHYNQQNSVNNKSLDTKRINKQHQNQQHIINVNNANNGKIINLSNMKNFSYATDKYNIYYDNKRPKNVNLNSEKGNNNVMIKSNATIYRQQNVKKDNKYPLRINFTKESVHNALENEENPKDNNL
jgi:hypothetical protein